MFVLYLPAARAGFVSDFTGWLDSLRHHSFSHYINRAGFRVVSLYQGTQFVTWLYYQVFGASVWAWHLLFVTLHALNATLLYTLCGAMLRDAGAATYKKIAFTGAVWFCITPSVSEVVVWEPSFHYLQGLLILLLILVFVQRYAYSSSAKYMYLAGAAYLFSTHTLEVFYITPWLVLTLGAFYRYQRPGGKEIFRRIVLGFFVPMLAIFLLRLIEFRLLHGDWVSRIGSGSALSLKESGLGKPAKYLFHLLLLGRYIPAEWHIGSLTYGTVRQSIYAFCDSARGISLFYGICAVTLAWRLFRYKYMAPAAKVATILFTWSLIALLLITPLAFGDLLLIIYDRYSYFASPFLFMLVSVGIWRIERKHMRNALITLLALANLRFAIQANRYWGKSARIIASLLQNLPAANDKIVVLLNLPDSMHGALMIGSSADGEYKLMRNLLLPARPLTGKVYDAMSYNMSAPGDGAHVRVVNDSIIRVTLNQWGTWWWYGSLGGHNYDNEDYSIRIDAAGHYDLIMKKPATQYLFYYQVGSSWKPVNMHVAYEQY